MVPSYPDSTMATASNSEQTIEVSKYFGVGKSPPARLLQLRIKDNAVHAELSLPFVLLKVLS